MRSRLFALLVLAVLALSACAADEDPGAAETDPDLDDDVTLSYWMWDSNQLPAYEACAADFTAETGIEIDFDLYGWDDYWSTLTTQFTAGRAPDVFTNHLAFYPTYAQDGVLVALDDFVERDGVDLDQYFPGLADLWVGEEGDRYGLPKDWDTIALFYDADMVADAGLSADDVDNATWNPDDGGTFQEVIAALSIDANGVRGNEDGFDPDNVEVYGLGYSNPAEAAGQANWSGFARTVGHEPLVDENPWGTQYQFDNPALADTLAWFREMIEAGYAAPIEEVQGLGSATMFEAGNLALTTDGSWMIGSYTGAEDKNVEIAPLPEGPEGRWSMFNGLADSITVDTEHPEEAWAWVSYLASPECQGTVGEFGVVFPAIDSATELAEATYGERGIDVSAFTTYLDTETTFLFPVTDNYDQVNAAMAPAVEEIFLGRAEAGPRLEEAQAEVETIMGN